MEEIYLNITCILIQYETQHRALDKNEYLVIIRDNFG